MKTRVNDKPKTSRRSFTLIELVVILSIITTLSALLLPVLNRAIALTEEIHCSNNMKGIGLGMQLYVNDYQYFPPYVERSKADSSKLHTWVALLLGNKAIESGEFFVCPTKNSIFADQYRNKAEEIIDSGNWSATAFLYPDYGYNWAHIGSSKHYVPGLPFPYAPPAKPENIRNPSATLLCSDSTAANNRTRGYYMIHDMYTTNSGFGVIEPRHNQRVNAVWADGHVDNTEAEYPNPYEYGVFSKCGRLRIGQPGIVWDRE